MKSFTLNLCLLLLLVSSQSCSIQKRVHLPGYHITGKRMVKNKSNIAKDEQVFKTMLPEKQKERSISPIQNNEIVQQVNATSERTFKKDNELKEEHISVNPFALQKTEKSSRRSIKSLRKKSILQTKAITQLISDKNERKVVEEKETKKSGSSALNTIGWIFIILGILFVIFISILIGILFMLLGLLFVLVGRT